MSEELQEDAVSELDQNEFASLQAGGYGSEFDSDAELSKNRKRQHDFAGLTTKRSRTTDGVAHKQEVTAEYSKEEGRKHRFHILSLDAYARHKQLINNYMLYYGGDSKSLQRDREKRLAKKYYDKLVREYCIADLSCYKENKVGMRWRIETEVASGKGQFSCGGKRCEGGVELRSWEVNFGYMEQGEKRNALVKLRLCPRCSKKLNYKHRRKEVTKKSKKQKQKEAAESRDDTPKEMLPPDSTPEPDPSDPTPSDPTTTNIWAGPAKITEDKTLDDEFDEYFEDMFL